MSNLTEFQPKFTAGHLRYRVNGNDSISGYLKCDGSVVLKSAYPKLAEVLSQATGVGFNPATEFKLPTSSNIFTEQFSSSTYNPTAYIKYE